MGRGRKNKGKQKHRNSSSKWVEEIASSKAYHPDERRRYFGSPKFGTFGPASEVRSIPIEQYLAEKEGGPKSGRQQE